MARSAMLGQDRPAVSIKIHPFLPADKGGEGDGGDPDGGNPIQTPL